MEPRYRISILRVAFIYAFFGVLWILFSDRMLESMITDLRTLTRLQTFKGWFFVTMSSILIYALLSREFSARSKAERELHRQQKFSDAVLNTAGALVFVLDGSGKIEYANQAAIEQTRFSIDELVDKYFWKILTPLSQAQTIKEVFSRGIEKGFPTSLESRILTRNHENILIAWSNTMLESDAGTIPHIVCTGIDITARERAELQARQRLSHLSALREIDLAITASLDLRHTLNIFIDQIRARLEVDAAVILLLNNNSLCLEHAASRGFTRTNPLGLQLRLGKGLAGKAAQERRPVFIHEIVSEDIIQDNPQFPLDEKFISYYAVPLIAKGEVKGVLELFQRSEIKIDSELLDFIDSLASQAAIAIDNAVLFDSLQRTNIELKLAYDTTLEGWSHALELRDRETEGHTARVTSMTLRLAKIFGVSEENLVHVRRGALLHDIGKMGIPDSILLKQGPLSDDEWEIMKLHPVYAFNMLSPIQFLRPALDIPYCHHEWWNGAGYPRKLKEKQIPIAARIFSVVDVWDALRSERPYHPAKSVDEAREYIKVRAGTQFDPKIVEIFLGINWDAEETI